MALVAFLRGVNVGGHRRFRPSLLAGQLAGHGVVNVGATGLLVAREPGSRESFQTDLLRLLPFETDVVICKDRELIDLHASDPFGSVRLRPDLVRFVSVLIGPAGRRLPPMPLTIPARGQWYVRIIGRHKRFVFGTYRRHMKTIRYLGRLEKALGARVTIRNWNTILTVMRILESE